MKAPLEGYRVLDWTVYHQGPIAAAHLADLGAEVIKIEPPEGDPGRKMLEKLGVDAPLNFYFHNNNRGKKSITLELKSEEGQKIARDLIGRADILLENFHALHSYIFIHPCSYCIELSIKIASNLLAE
jgi:crotonobetainyl-CoA:carnitine CoA-transferase CaiB-like acyl-CoA transferase